MSMVAAADHSHSPVFSQFISPTDWPASLTIVVSEARRILSYYRELPEKARPPKSIWHSYDKCKDFIDKNMGAKEGKEEMLSFNPNEVEL